MRKVTEGTLSGLGSVLRDVSSGFHNYRPQTRQMVQHEFILSQFWGWKFKTSMPCGQLLLRAILWLQRVTPTLSSHSFSTGLFS